MSLVAAVKELKHSAHQIAAIGAASNRDRLTRLSLDLRLIVMSFLTAAEAMSLCSVSSSGQKLRCGNERCCRLLYRLMFGECSARDMELFEFSADSSWRHRFHVQFGTACNWFEPSAAVVTVGADPNLAGVIDGHSLACSYLQQFDLPTLALKPDPLKNPVVDAEYFLADPTISVERGGAWCILVHDKRSGRVIHQINQDHYHFQCDPMSDLLFSDYSLDVDDDKPVAIWSASTGTLVAGFSIRRSNYYATAHTGELFATEQNRESDGDESYDVLVVYDMRTGKVDRSTAVEHHEHVVAATPDHLLLSRGDDLELRVLCRSDLNDIDQTPIDRDARVCTDASGRNVVLLTRDQVKFWTIHRQRWFSFNARYLVYCTEKRLVLHDFSARQLRQQSSARRTPRHSNSSLSSVEHLPGSKRQRQH